MVKFLLCVIDIYRKYGWVAHWGTKNALQTLMHSEKSLMNLAVNQTKYGLIGTVSFTMDQWSRYVYWNVSKHNKWNSVVAERFIGALKNKIYINKLDERVDKYNKIYFETMEMKPADVQPGIYVKYGIEYNDEDSKFKVV